MEKYREFRRKPLTNLVFVLKYTGYVKGNAETKQKTAPQREGDGASPLRESLYATSKPPGMTGTGAPVTEPLRCLCRRRIRVVPRFTSPLCIGATYLFGGRAFWSYRKEKHTTKRIRLQRKRWLLFNFLYSKPAVFIMEKNVGATNGRLW